MSSVEINIENPIPGDHSDNAIIDTQLHKCVKQDNTDAFKTRVQHHLIEKLVTPCENTLLHVAVSYGSDKIIAYLAEEFPSLITRRNSQNDTVLHLAARVKSPIHTVKFLVESNPSLMRMANTMGNTPLHDAVINGNEEIARLLVSKDPGVANYSNKNGRSPLYLAVENGKKNGILDDLLALGAAIPTAGEDGDSLPQGKSPVHAAIEQRNIELSSLYSFETFLSNILKKIEKAKPGLLCLTDDDLGNSLHYTSSIGFLEGVQFLLDKFLNGAYERNSEGNYPIHLACKNDSDDLVKEFLKITPFPKEFLNKKGQNILHVAAESGKGNVVRYILEQDKTLVGSLLNEMDEDGNTPLHLAALQGQSMAAFVLIAKEREQFDSENSTPALENQMTTLSILYFHACPRKYIYERFTVTQGKPPRKQETKSRIENLLVIAVLVAGVTFAGAVQMPQLRGKTNSNDHPLEFNSTATASGRNSTALDSPTGSSLLDGYLCLDVWALNTSVVAAIISGQLERCQVCTICSLVFILDGGRVDLHDVLVLLFCCEHSIRWIQLWGVRNHRYSCGGRVLPCSNIALFSMDSSTIRQPNY
uniref:Uncharacterized protein n=1 Tax=Salix viminalis TaxID=40686 RepID=A0A6N2MFR3_SALVM